MYAKAGQPSGPPEYPQGPQQHQLHEPSSVSPAPRRGDQVVEGKHALSSMRPSSLPSRSGSGTGAEQWRLSTLSVGVPIRFRVLLFVSTAAATCRG